MYWIYVGIMYAKLKFSPDFWVPNTNIPQVYVRSPTCALNANSLIGSITMRDG